ncbi:hypothetical protein [Photobacterium leiognathi]|uniref:hypothetical protein n=1 Tax=Photobacterium leiognathi TaxID=553611 RepID=UPI002739AB6B|nr:hypothetical protein [Photobacterium leiognathi]
MFNIAPVYLVNNNTPKIRYAQAITSSPSPVEKATVEKKAPTVAGFHGYDNRGEIQPKTTAKGRTINISV